MDRAGPRVWWQARKSSNHVDRPRFNTPTQFDRLERRDLLAVVVAPLQATENTLFNDQVATFQAADVAGITAPLVATINWGNGTSNQGLIQQTNGEFTVNGFNTYTGNGSFTVKVSIGGANSSTVTGEGPATVLAIPPQVFGTTVEAIAGATFTEVVANILDPNPNEVGPNYQATITWETGRTTPGTIKPLTGGRFQVEGTYSFEDSGVHSVFIEVFEEGLATPVTAQTTVTVVAAPSVTGTTINAVAGQQFEGTVASFTDAANPGAVPTNYRAEITWENGMVSSNGAIVAVGSGFEVRGAKTYATAGNYPITVKVTRVADSVDATAASQAIVGSFLALSGKIEAGSDLGPSSTDGITSLNSPLMFGTATPFSVVQLYVIRAGTSDPLPVGQAVTGSDGIWRTRLNPLQDGRYQVAATQAQAGFAPGALENLQLITIDTVAPRVVNLSYSPQLRQATVVYRDDLAGLDVPSTLDLRNYTFIGPPLRRVRPSAPPASVAMGTIPQDPQAVDVALPAKTPSRRPGLLRILSGGVMDLAGNPLDGNGDSTAGDNFQANLAKHTVARRSPIASAFPKAFSLRRMRTF